MVLKECKADPMALCEQYCAEQGWRPPSKVVYKKAHKPARRKVDYPYSNIWDADDLSNGEESGSEGLPMGSWSPTYLRELALTVDGLRRECELISFNSFSSPL